VDCIADGVCDRDCGADDPDCACDRRRSACDAAEDGSTEDCACDLDCDASHHACDGNGYCDEWCPEGFDIDCGTCPCDYFGDVCEADDLGSTDDCLCDLDCTDGHHACEADAHCDSWCPDGADPD
jgi:hypothetical protein